MIKIPLNEVSLSLLLLEEGDTEVGKGVPGLKILYIIKGFVIDFYVS